MPWWDIVSFLFTRICIFDLCFSALEITGENLEDLLAYDDLFLDYFNAFLQLPVRYIFDELLQLRCNI